MKHAKANTSNPSLIRGSLQPFNVFGVTLLTRGERMKWSVPQIILLAAAVGFAMHVGNTLAGYAIKPPPYYVIVCTNDAESPTCRTLQTLRGLEEKE